MSDKPEAPVSDERERKIREQHAAFDPHAWPMVAPADAVIGEVLRLLDTERATVATLRERLDGECETCGGTGVMSVLARVESPNEHEVYEDAECGECHGTGKGWIGEVITSHARLLEAAKGIEAVLLVEQPKIRYTGKNAEGRDTWERPTLEGQKMMRLIALQDAIAAAASAPQAFAGTTSNTAVDANWSGDPLSDATRAWEAMRDLARRLAEAMYALRESCKYCERMGVHSGQECAEVDVLLAEARKAGLLG